MNIDIQALGAWTQQIYSSGLVAEKRGGLISGYRVIALREGEPTLVLDAEVSYVQERIGTGVRFVGLNGADHARISAYVDEARHRKSLGGPPLRKSARVFIQVPVRVRGARTNGPAFDEETRIVTLRAWIAARLDPPPA